MAKLGEKKNSTAVTHAEVSDGAPVGNGIGVPATLVSHTNTKPIDAIQEALNQGGVVEAVLSGLQKHKALTIQGLDDKDGYKAVDEARKECKRIRLLAEKICKEGRSEAIEIQKKWVAMEKAVVGRVEDVEGDLEQKLKAIDDEVARLKREKEEAERARVAERQKILQEQGAVWSFEAVAAMSDKEYEDLLQKSTKEKLERDAKEAADRAELEALRREKAEREAELLKSQSEATKIQEEGPGGFATPTGTVDIAWSKGIRVEAGVRPVRLLSVDGNLQEWTPDRDLTSEELDDLNAITVAINSLYGVWIVNPKSQRGQAVCEILIDSINDMHEVLLRGMGFKSKVTT